MATLSPRAPSSARAELVDFSNDPAIPPTLSEIYAGHFALVIHDFLTPAECASLVRLAESSQSWEEALVNTGGGRQKLISDVRNSQRIMRDDPAVADALFARCLPFLEEYEVTRVRAPPTAIRKRGPDGKVLKTQPPQDEQRWKKIATMGMAQHDTWRLKRMNERLRFLKYGPGQYFRAHCDGLYETPDGKERSFLTFHLYLQDPSSEQGGPVGGDLSNGSTRFFDYSMKEWIDISPRVGSVLIFQHNQLLHSGEPPMGGTKITVRSDFMYERVPED